MAEGDGIFAGVGQYHEFMGKIAADGAGVRFHGPELEAQASENARIGVVHQLVALLGPGAVRVKGVTVFHHEFAPAHQAEAGADFIAELALDLIEPHGQLAVGTHFAAHQVSNDFLMGGAQAIFALVTVLEAQQFLAVVLPAARFLPEVGGLNHGHEQFLEAGGIDFLAHHVGDFVNDLQAQRQIDIQAGGEPAHHARAQQKLVADHLGISRRFLEGGNVTGAEAHESCFLAMRFAAAPGVRRAALFH